MPDDQKSMLSNYVCPQCVPDPAGAEEHARTHHTFAGLLGEDGFEVAEPMLPKFMCRHCGFEVEAVGQPMCCGSNMAAHPDEWGRRQVALQPCGHPVSAVVSSNEGTAYCECDIEDANHG